MRPDWEDLAVPIVAQIAFLPGAGGSPEFWKPVADRLPAGWEPILLGLPGAGDQPHDPLVGSFEDLIELTASRLSDGTDVIAQSMGGVVGVGMALRYPMKVRRLVLVATSGGIDVGALGASDWREEYRAGFPVAASWVTEATVDYTVQLKGVGRCCCGAIMIRSARSLSGSGSLSCCRRVSCGSSPVERTRWPS